MEETHVRCIDTSQIACYQSLCYSACSREAAVLDEFEVLWSADIPFNHAQLPAIAYIFRVEQVSLGIVWMAGAHASQTACHQTL